MHGLVFETSIWLLAGSTRLLTQFLLRRDSYFSRKHSHCHSSHNLTTGFSFPTRPQLDHTDHRPPGTSRALSDRCSPHAGRDRTCQSTHSQASARLKDFQHYAFFSIQQPLSPIAGLQVRRSAHRTSATCHKNFGGCSLSGDSQKSFKFLIAFSCHDCSQLPLIYRKSPSP